MKRIPLLLKIVIAIVLGVACGQFFPDVLVRLMNTFCGLFDQWLHFLIPLIIAGLVAPAIADVGGRAGRMLLLTVALAYGFTVCSGLFAYAFSIQIFPTLIEGGSLAQLSVAAREYTPFFRVEISPLMDVMTALVLAFMLGLGMAFMGTSLLKRGFYEFREIVVKTIEKTVIPLLPPYVFGLFLDITAAGKVAPVLSAFISVICVIFAMSLLLLILQFCVAGAVVRRNPLRLLATMLPAYFTALGTSSSAATIPVTYKRTLLNGVSEAVAGFTVPLCATIHMSGSTLKITSCAVALMLMLGAQPDFNTFLGFVMMLGVTMVAAPGVPGGAVMAALGVMEGILGFDSGQQSMMITLYIAMDSFGTACNVTGDGAIALIVNRIAERKRVEMKN